MIKIIKKMIYPLILLILIPFSFAEIIDILDQAAPASYCDSRYELEAVYISGSEVKFRLNNETSDILGRHDLFKFEEGSSIYVREILEEEAKEGPDKVSIRFYPKICIEPIRIIPEETGDIAEEQKEPQEIEEMPEEEQKEYPEEIIPPEKEEKSSFLDLLINWLKNLFAK